METFALIVTGITVAGGSTWALCWALRDIKEALAIHVIEEKSEREKLAGRVIKLEKVERARRR